MPKPPKEIPRISSRIKRGTDMIIIENGEAVKFYIINHQGLYLVTRADGSLDLFTEDELKLASPRRTGIKQVVKPISAEERERRESLDEFFDKMGLIIPYNCENCGKPLYAFTKKAKRSVSAHILPKSVFKSIATDPDNILFMGADFIGCPCNCHDRWDSNSDTRASMNIYEAALKRFNSKLKHKLTPHELKQAFTYLKLEWQ